jgi:FtsP/CotA-like multicopper oxidase with cupredoxin domain
MKSQADVPEPAAPPTVSRRELMKLGVAAGGSALLSGANPRRAGASREDPTPPPPSPATTPWVHWLPAPPVKQALASPDSLTGGPPNPAEHQYYERFAPQKYYEMTVKAGPHTFHDDLDALGGPSTIWGYDGIFPGPTFDARYGEPILLRIHNDLPTDYELAENPTFGINDVITHLHNHHTATESDGGPWDYYGPGHFHDHHYGMCKPGFTDPATPDGDPNESMGTHFYHAHRPDFTSAQVYKGQTGFFRAFDYLDTGNETTGLRLPSGEFDVPLLFTDKRFDENGQLAFDPFELDGILGDKDVVNGVIQPKFKVQRRKYRFRMLVGGPARFYRFYLMKNGTFLTNNPFIQIANDGNLLGAPIRRSNLLMSPAERFDIVIDFKALTTMAGGELFLYNRAEQLNGRQPSGNLLTPGQPVLKFIVEPGDVADPSRVPATLRPQVAVPVDLTGLRTRTFDFHRGNGAWQINDEFFDHRRISASCERDSAEIWVLKNVDNSWQHPIHIHFEEFHILSRNGVAPPAWERGRKDVLILKAETVRIFMRFRDFPQKGFVHPDPERQKYIGRYPMHCHNLTHEDHAMMLRWDILPSEE